MFCTFLHIHQFKSSRKVGSRGFSLIELMVTIAIVGIIATIGYPSLMKFRANAKTRGVASDIFSSLRMVKSEAVKRNVNVCLELKAAGTYKAFLDNGAIPNNCIQDADELTTLFTKTVEPGTSIVADFKAGYTPRGRPYTPLDNIVVQNDSNPLLQYKNTISIAGRVDILVSQDGGDSWD